MHTALHVLYISSRSFEQSTTCVHQHAVEGAATSDTDLLRLVAAEMANNTEGADVTLLPGRTHCAETFVSDGPAAVSTQIWPAVLVYFV